MRQFFTTIFGDQQGNVTIGLRDQPGPSGKLNRYEWFQYPEQLDSMVAYCEAHADGDLYFSPLVYGDDVEILKSGRKIIARTPENAKTTHCIYLDADTARPQDFRLSPSIIVQTSKDRYHCYWMLTEPTDSGFAANISHRITTAHKASGSDQNGWSANKVLRVPFSKNTSHGFYEEVTVAYTGELYDVNDLSGAYDDVDVTERPYMRPSENPIVIDTPEDLPDYGTTLEKLPREVLRKALAEPRENNRSELRYALLCSLFRSTNLSFEEVLSVAWHAPASRKWSLEDSRGINGLIAEAVKAQTEVEAEKEIQASAPTPDEGVVNRTSTTDAFNRVSLLSDSERESLAGDENWISRYVKWTSTKYPKQNAPYDRINAWTILSAALCDVGFIPRRNGPERLNLYTMTLGDTTTGKTAALRVMFNVLKECFSEDQGYNIGGNSSPSALGRKLIERDGKVSFFNRDEAHGVLKTWSSQDWTTGIMEDLALLYDGHVPPQLRTGNWESSGKSAETFFLMHLMGTPDAIVSALSREMFLTGFLARFCWVIGEPRTVTKESMAEIDSDGNEVKLGFDPMARQFAAEFANVKRIIRQKHSARQIAVKISAEGARRMQEVKWTMSTMLTSHRNWDILEPSLVRMGVTIRKCASLLALSEGKDVADERHVLLAIEAAEEWVTNLVNLSDKISASDFERACDRIEQYVVERGGSVELAVLNRRFRAIDARFLDGYLKALIGQGRLREGGGEKQRKYIELNKED